MFTEKQAKEKTCPQARGLMPRKCCGSSCMAWRFADIGRRKTIPAIGWYKDNRPADGWKFLSSEDNDGDGDVWVQPMEAFKAERVGFCALVVGSAL